MIQVTSIIRLALLGLLLAASPSHGQEAETQEVEVFEEIPITYRMKKKYFYVLSGPFKDKNDQDRIFYDRFTISPRCPDVFSTFTVTYPKSKERELSKFVTRLSHSLRSTCQGESSFLDNNTR